MLLTYRLAHWELESRRVRQEEPQRLEGSRFVTSQLYRSAACGSRERCCGVQFYRVGPE